MNYASTNVRAIKLKVVHNYRDKLFHNNGVTQISLSYATHKPPVFRDEIAEFIAYYMGFTCKRECQAGPRYLVIIRESII